MNPKTNNTNQPTDNKRPSDHLSQPAPPEQLDGLPQIVFPPASQRPVYRCYDDPFLVGTEPYPAGVYFHDIHKKKGNSETLSDLWVCSVLRIIAIGRTETGKRVCIVEFVSQGETPKRREAISQCALLARRLRVLGDLRSWGVSVLCEHVKAVRNYLDQQHLEVSESTPELSRTSEENRSR